VESLFDPEQITLDRVRTNKVHSRAVWSVETLFLDRKSKISFCINTFAGRKDERPFNKETQLPFVFTYINRSILLSDVVHWSYEDRGSTFIDMLITRKQWLMKDPPDSCHANLEQNMGLIDRKKLGCWEPFRRKCSQTIRSLQIAHVCIGRASQIWFMKSTVEKCKIWWHTFYCSDCFSELSRHWRNELLSCSYSWKCLSPLIRGRFMFQSCFGCVTFWVRGSFAGPGTRQS
jgi:hypothetical protein